MERELILMIPGTHHIKVNTVYKCIIILKCNCFYTDKLCFIS